MTKKQCEIDEKFSKKEMTLHSFSKIDSDFDEKCGSIVILVNCLQKFNAPQELNPIFTAA